MSLLNVGTLQSVLENGATATTQALWTAGGIKLNDNISLILGTSGAASFKHNGTDLIIDSGSTSNVTRVGTLTTDARNFYTFRLGLGDTVATAGSLVQATTTSSTISGVFSATLTHTGTTNTLRTMLFTAVHQGTNTTGAQTSIGAAFTGNIDSDSTTGVRTGIGVQGTGGFASGRVQSQGTSDFRSVIAKTPGAGGTHTGGTIRSRCLIIEAEPTYAGTATVAINVAGQCQGNFHILQNKALYLGGTALALPTNFFQFLSASSEIETQVGGAQVFKWSTSTITIADAKNIAVGTTTGTKIGTATTQKLGFYNATPVTQRADAGALTDSTTGAVDGTLVDVGAVPTQANINNNFADCADRINKIRTVLRDLGFMA